MASEKDLEMIIDLLSARLKRLPTEDEVIDFIMGDQATKDRVWNGQSVPTDRV